MYSTLIIAVVCVALVQCEPVPAPNTNCKVKNPNSGLSDSYWESIGHAIHSLDIQSLQMFIPRANEDNKIPTVNMNMSAPIKVLDNAPNNPLTHDFFTPEMNLIDRILTRVGVSDDGLGVNWTPLERIVHNFHMRDLWSALKPSFDKVNFKVDATVCECLLNVHESGVRSAVEWIANHYAKGTPISLLNRPIPVLEDSEDWKIWKDRLLHYYTEEALFDASYFLRCAANVNDLLRNSEKIIQ